MAKIFLCFLVLTSCCLYAQSTQKALTTPSISTLPLAGFEENKGQILNHQQQAAPQVHFQFQQSNTTVFLLSTGLAYQFEQVHYPKGYAHNTQQLSPEQLAQQLQLEQQVQVETYRMDMELVNAHPNPAIVTEGKSSSYNHYYNKNILDGHSYSKVIYKEVYPGIDWVIYTTNQGIKYDFVVAAGADPSQIQCRFKHQEQVQLQRDGSLLLSNSMGQIQEQAPIAFQGEQEVAAAFELKGNLLQFSIGAYDKNKELVIDPSVTWATYYGTNRDDRAYATTVDQQGFVYMAGLTRSSSNFAQAGHQTNYGNGGDAFLAKFSSSGARQWVTYYGGSGADVGTSCAIDNANNVYLAGNTISTNNISTTGSHQELIGNASFNSGFLVKFQPNGTRLWGTYYSGGLTTADACATDGLGNVYLAGYTRSSGSASSMIITTGAHQTINRGNDDAYLVKFSSTGVRQWGTFYGGADTDRALSCATDAQNNIYLAGQTASPGNLAQTNGNIALGGHQNTFGGNQDAFLAKFNTNGTRQWGTYYGGTSLEVGYSCIVDGADNVYLAGVTVSSNAIATATAYQTSRGGSSDAFLVKFNSAGARQWGTYYGGSSAETALGCTVDAQNNVYLAGNTESTNNIATTGAVYGGLRDGLLVKFSSNGTRQWGTYYGGSNYDDIASCAAGNNALYMVGETSSSTGIALMGFQNTFAGSRDAFLAAFRQNACVPSSDTLVQQACDGFTFNGQLYTNSGFYSDTLTNVVGCDSIITLNLTINNSTTSTLIQTFCDSFVFNGNTYTSSGNYIDTISNAVGCDSIINLNLTIIYSNTGTDNQTACDSFTWIDGNTYTSSNNTATVTLTNSQGCDSVVTLNLIINNSSTAVEVQTACDSFTWIDGNTYTSSNNTATVTLTNSQGCDSVVTLNLTINTVDVSTQNMGNSLTANATGATYQWVDCDSNKIAIVGATGQSFSPSKNGNYAVIITQNGCTDTSACVSFIRTAVQELPSTLQPAIFPNPTTGAFAVDLGDWEQAQVQIFAANGQLLQQHHLQGQGIQELELKGAAGIYFIQIQVGQQVHHNKLIKQ